MNSNAEAWSPRPIGFGPFVLDPDRLQLWREGVPVRVGARALDILAALLERPGEVLSKRELMARVWPSTVVEDDTLKVHLVALRRALGDDAGAARYIATVTGRGYRFVAPVHATEAPRPLAGSTAAAAHSDNLPAKPARILGRAEAIDAVRRGLAETRVFSIVGAGGVGKTTIAIAAAREAAPDYADGAAFVDLATISDPQFVPAAIASALGLGVTGGDPLSSIVHALQRRQKILFLDNCEHLLVAVAAVVDRLNRQADGVRILTTSREPLRIRSERVYRLRGLECDPSDVPVAEAARRFPAVDLFALRAAERSGIHLTDAEAPAVAEICRRLDGNPLAIELAATQTAALSAAQILRMLDDRFRLLRLGPPGAPLRQQSLLATLDWSYSLLSEREAALLRAISVFAGTFRVDGAIAVSTLAPAEASEALAQLASKSLLLADAGDAPVSYRLLETTRAYCLERLQVSAEGDATRRRHAEHICAVLERAAAEWEQRTIGEWEAAFGHLVDDLRGALAWAARDPAQRSLRIRLTAAGVLLWNHYSLTDECRQHLSEAVAELGAAGQAGTAVEMQLQMSLAGNTLFSRGLADPVMNAMQRALDIATRIGNSDARLRWLRTIGACEIFGGRHDAGIRTLEDCASLAAGTSGARDASAERERENYLAIGELFVGQLQRAKQRLERLYNPDLGDTHDSRLVRFLVYRNVDLGSVLSHAQWLTGFPETAARTAAATVDDALETRYWFSVSNCISWACPVFFLAGRHEECRHYVDLLEEQVLRYGIGVRRPVVTFYRGALACAQQCVPAEGIDELARGIEEFRTVNYLARMPFYLGVLADALTRSGRLGEAQATLQAAFDCAAIQNERWCVPELLRIRASTLAAAGRLDAAEALLAESMAMARDIEALSWRLRAANDLAKLWRLQSRTDEVRRMLQTIYSGFTEGFDTGDLAVAAELLA